MFEDSILQAKALVEALREQGRFWLMPFGTTTLFVLLSLCLHRGLFFIAARLAARTRMKLDDYLVAHMKGPALAVFLVSAVYSALAPFEMPEGLRSQLPPFEKAALLFLLVWIVVNGSNVFRDLLYDKFDMTVEDNIRARTVITQYRVFQRIFVIVAVFLALATALTFFERFRNIGTGILASAGLAGIVVGFSAQRTLANILAGVQIAFTQPIRLDDAVLVENEWGWIEDIGFTFVTVRIWDKRRLVLPIHYFLDRPFQNWTMRSGDIVGSVFLKVDYGLNVDELRTELRRICNEEGKGLWDGQACLIQVTDADDRSMTLRALVTSSNSPKNWDLRCLVRERLVAWICENHPERLPRVRIMQEEEVRASGATPDQ